MPRHARIHYVSLHSSLVNLPISVYGPLLERGVRPQSLVVHITSASSGRKGKVESYVGWTGLASASSLSRFASGSGSASGETIHETVEIDPQFAQGLGFAAGDIVDLALLYDLPIAQSVGTEPVSPDDWEIIELHGSHIESTLLQQARVAAIGQELNVWVLGRTRVRLTVVSLDPTPKAHKALLLSADTEVSVAPKARGNPTAAAKHDLTNKPTANGASAPAHAQTSYIFRVLPSRLLLGQSADDASALYVSQSTFTRIANTEAEVVRLRGPSDPNSSPASAETATPTQAKALDINGTRLIVRLHPGIPEGHLCLGNVSLVHGLEDWDLVRVTVPPAEQSQAPPSLTEAPEVLERPSALLHHKALAGVSDILERGISTCRNNLVLHGTVSVVTGVPGLLITGKSGAGKTSVANAIATALADAPGIHARPHYVDLSRIAEKPVSVVHGLFKYWYDKAAWHRPSLLVLDNIDKLLGAELEHADSFRSRHLSALFMATFGPGAANSRGIMLVATAESRAALHPMLGTSHLFKEAISLKPPNREARRDILRAAAQQRSSQDQQGAINFTALATQTEGYSATDLEDLVARAVHQAAMRGADATLGMNDFTAAQVDFTPLSLRDVKLQKSETEWADIGGLREPKKTLRETLEWPTKYGPIFAQSPLRLRSGLLLYGYPGCGKTLLASAVAKECGLNFISVKGPEILNKYIGASEKSVRDLFERASAAKPCVLFFDEFDSIAPKRGHDSTGVTDRVVNQMLTQMDGAEGLDGVYVLAATSRPDLIDSALLRPGRLDKSILCDMPDAEERKEIVQSLARKITLSPSIDLDRLAGLTDGYSGADLQALLYNAHLEVIHAAMLKTTDEGEQKSEAAPLKYVSFGGKGKKAKSVLSKAQETALERRLTQMLNSSADSKESSAATTSPSKQEITEEHIRRVLQTTRPSVSFEERDRLRRIYLNFVDDRSGDLPHPPEPFGIGIRASLA